MKWINKRELCQHHAELSTKECSRTKMRKKTRRKTYFKKRSNKIQTLTRKDLDKQKF